MAFISRLIERLLYPSPDLIVHSILERSYKSDLMMFITDIIKIREAHVAVFSADESAPSWLRRQYAFQARNIYQLKNCEVILPVGGICCGGFWLQESFGHYRNVLIDVSQWRKRNFLFRRTHVVKDSCYYLRTTGYYHFVLEALPALLHVLKRIPDITVIVSNTMRHKEYLFINQYLQILREQGLVKKTLTVEGARIQCACLAFTQQEEKSGFVHKDDIELLRKTFLPTITRASEQKKLFITRRNAKRAFDNQEAIGVYLETQGFICIELESLSIVEQIQLFVQAEVVVANHGAGLANLVWCSQCNLVVELFSPMFLNDCYFRLARSMDINYQSVVASKRAGDNWGQVETEKLNLALGKQESSTCLT